MRIEHHTLISAAVSDLAPTQCCVGYIEVQDKRAQWERLSHRARRTALDQHYFPTIIGPDDRPFIIDRHHLALALHEVPKAWEDPRPILQETSSATCSSPVGNFWMKAARQLLDEGGPAALSMREVARRTDCTHQAPYHYFENREAILASLVADGFDALAACLKEANDLGLAKWGRAALIASAKAYIDFALTQPGVFRIMFRPEVCDPSRFPSVQASGARARDELDRLNTIVHGKKAQATMAAILWAHVHGLAFLLLDGPLVVQFETALERTKYLQSVGEEFADLILSKVIKSEKKPRARKLL